MRDAMPKVSEFVDACRGVFGVLSINNAIRDGIDVVTKVGEFVQP